MLTITEEQREGVDGVWAQSRSLPAGSDVFRARLVLALAEGHGYRQIMLSLGLSKSTVQRIWTQLRLKPHRLDRSRASNDPQFEEKAADIIGLYLHPPQHAAVFCVDEKTAIQALDRLDPVLPLSPGRAERHGFEYYRHGTLSLYAA